MSDVASRLAALEPSLRGIARRQAGARADLVDDLAQEARLAAWSALETRPEAPDAYLATAAVNAVRKVATGRRGMAGTPGRQGKRTDLGADLLGACDSLDATFEDGDAREDAVDLRAEGAVEAVSVAVTVRQAVARLDASDRLLVFRRFWLDAQPTKTEHNRWRVVRDLLATDLADAA